MKACIERTLQTAGVFVLISMPGLRVCAQDSDAARRRSDQDLDQRVFNLGILRKGKTAPKPNGKGTDPQALLKQVQNDFTYLQIIDNTLAESLSGNRALDLDWVVKSTSEIEKCAERLLDNLTSPKPEKNSKGSNPTPIVDRAQLKQTLVALDSVIVEFSHNPVFKEESPDDAKLAAKALKDLDQIVLLSAQARKSSELMKETEKSP